MTMKDPGTSKFQHKV